MTEAIIDDKKHKVPIPKYSLGEELISAISHGVGGLLSIAALVISIVVAAKSGSAAGVVGCAIYGSTMIILYVMSCIYHALVPCQGKRVFRVFDHCTIYLMIAGTYTPFTLVSLKGAVGWVLFGIVWGFAVLGIIFNAIDLEKYKIPSMIAYLGMGWAIIFAFPKLYAAVSFRCLLFLILGGVVYTLGAIVYGVGSKVKYMHSIWHFFVLGGSVLHFFAILFIFI